MYTYGKYTKSSIKSSEKTEGETIEMKVMRLLHNKEPIKDGAPIIHTERKDGVIPGYNIRTDRFEVAADGMDLYHKNRAAKRENSSKMEVSKNSKKEEKIGGPEPVQDDGTGGK